jgi:hypothetical protein
MQPIRFRAFQWTVLAMLLMMAAYAQTTSSSIKGSLVDTSGAPIPGAACTLTNRDTGAAAHVQSDVSGAFVFPSVSAGVYSLKVTVSGFKALQIRDVIVTSSEVRTLGALTMQIGELVESVTVTAEAAALQMASGERSGLVTSTQLEDIALKGRDLFSLLATIPGVVDTVESRETASGGIAGTYINGARENQKNFTVDGITNLDVGANVSVGVPPQLDSIAEIRILTSNYQAEFGRNSGGAIAVITKSGGKQFHGSGYGFFRNESLNANNFFFNRTGTQRPYYRYQIKGYSIGGPIYIPGKFNTGKDKLFFFLSQEFTAQKQDDGANFVTVPTLLERAGNFSRSYDVNGAQLTVKDPLTGQPFPGNIVPAARISKLGQSILNFYPEPNYIDADQTNLNRYNYRSHFSGDAPRRSDVLRIDYNATPSLLLYARILNSDSDRTRYWGSWQTGSVNYDMARLQVISPASGQTLHLTKTFSPTVVYEFKFGRNEVGPRSFDYIDQDKVQRSRMGNPPQWFEDPGMENANYVPDVKFGGQPLNTVNSTMATAPYGYHNPVYTFTNTLSKVHHSHSLKAGLYAERANIDITSGNNYRGAFDFTRDTNNPFDSNHSFANALLGYFRSYSEATQRRDSNFVFWNVEWFVQDNWRVSRRLTLDLGIRFYHNTPAIDEHQNIATFDPTRYNRAAAPALYLPAKDASGKRVARNPVTGELAIAPLIGQYVPGSGTFANGTVAAGQDGYPNSLYTRPWLAYGPRIGFAYDVTGKGRTVLRGGFGIFQDTGQNNPIMGMRSNPPVTYTPTLWYGSLENYASTGGAYGPSDMNAMFGHSKLPYTMNYSLGVQRLFWNTVIEASYVGSVARHLYNKHNINPIPMYSRFDPANQDPTQPGKPLPDNFFRPYAGHGGVFVYEYAGTSNYNSLQVSANRRFRGGLQFGIAYTRSKALGVGVSDYVEISPYFPTRSRNYGPLDYDRAHVFVMNYSYQLPKFSHALGVKASRFFVDNWVLSGITTFTTGSPFTPTYATVDGLDETGSSEAARIMVVGDPSLAKSERTFYRQFNTDAFARPAKGSFGNAGVNVLRRPGTNNWDISASKRFSLWDDKRYIQFRGETFNAWNHTQFSGLDTSARFDQSGKQIDGAFGSLTSARSPRIVQLSLKLIF